MCFWASRGVNSDKDVLPQAGQTQIFYCWWLFTITLVSSVAWCPACKCTVIYEWELHLPIVAALAVFAVDGSEMFPLCWTTAVIFVCALLCSRGQTARPCRPVLMSVPRVSRGSLWLIWKSSLMVRCKSLFTFLANKLRVCVFVYVVDRRLIISLWPVAASVLQVLFIWVGVVFP